jgi:hypothetical protein
MYYHCIFMFADIFGVDHDPSNFYNGYVIVLGALRVYSTRVAS